MPANSSCRYVKGKCFGLGMRGISMCEDRSCPGPPGGEFPATNETKPAAPETREEVAPMASPKKPALATCPECKRDQVLYACKYAPEDFPADTKFCGRCSAKFANRAKKGHAPKVAAASTASKAASATKTKKPVPSKDQEPIASAKPAPAPAAAPVVADQTQGRAVVLRFTCHEPQEVAALLIAARSMSCSVGLDG